MRNTIYILVISFISTLNLSAREIWSLSQCICYALDNNIDLKIAENNVSHNKANVFEAKVNILPSFNAGSTIDSKWGRNIDDNTNSITYSSSVNNNIWIGASMVLFQGFIKHNTIGYTKYLLKTAENEKKIQENKLVLNVLSTYFKIIYSKELEQVAKEQVALTHNLYERMQKLIEVGRELHLTAQELNSHLAEDKLMLTHASNNTASAILEIKKLLCLDSDEHFEVDTLQFFALDLETNTNLLYNIALSKMPEIKQQEYYLKAARKATLIAKGKMLPQLSLHAQAGSNYFNSASMAYKEQLRGNLSTRLSFNLVIPLFNGASTSIQLKKNKIAMCKNELLLEQAKDNLYAEISNVVNDLEFARNEYLATLEVCEFRKLALEGMDKKMASGLIGVVDLEHIMQRYALAKANMLKAKLTYILKKHTLEFYKNGNWKHLYV
jgi:outer membrane protein